MIKWVDWNPLAITGTRGLIATLAFWVLLRRPQFTWSSAQIGGGVAYAFTGFLFITATKWTTAANAIILQYTAPVYVALFGIWFLKESVRKMDWFLIAGILGGMVLFFFDQLSMEGLWGNILAILSSITFAWFILFLRKQKHQSPVESVLIGSAIAAMIGFPFMFDSLPDLQSWLALLFLGLIQQGLALFLYTTAIKHVTALEAIVISTLEPIFNPIWVLWFIGELPGFWALAGGSVVIVVVTFRGIVIARQH